MRGKGSSPENKFFGGIFCLIISAIGLIVGIIFCCKEDAVYSIISKYIIIFSSLGLLCGVIMTLIGKINMTNSEEDLDSRCSSKEDLNAEFLRAIEENEVASEFYPTPIPITLEFAARKELASNEDRKTIEENAILNRSYLLNENEINLINKFQNRLNSIKNKVFTSYPSCSFPQVMNIINSVENFDIFHVKQLVSLHFFYNDITNYIYTLRDVEPQAIEFCLSLCDKDIKILPQTFLTDISTPTISRKAIILEKQQEYEEIIELCDFAVSHKYYDNGKSFGLRKIRIEKKLNKGGKLCK